MAAQADLADDVVGESEGLVAQPGRQMRAAQIEEDALRVVELLLPEEQLAVHLDADADAVRERRARNRRARSRLPLGRRPAISAGSGVRRAGARSTSSWRRARRAVLLRGWHRLDRLELARAPVRACEQRARRITGLQLLEEPHAGLLDRHRCRNVPRPAVRAPRPATGRCRRSRSPDTGGRPARRQRRRRGSGEASASAARHGRRDRGRARCV